MSINQCNFIGRLGGNPEVKTIGSGTAVANFTIACSEKWKDKQGQQQEKTEWVRAVAWSRLAEICGEYLHKGSLVYISGKMETRQWEDKEGNKRYTTEIVVREMKMLDTKQGGGQQQQNAPVSNAGQEDVPF